MYKCIRLINIDLKIFVYILSVINMSSHRLHGIPTIHQNLSNILHMYIIFIICTYIHLYIIFVFVMTIVRMNECIYENIEFYKTIYILYVYIIVFGYIMKKKKKVRRRLKRNYLFCKIRLYYKPLTITIQKRNKPDAFNYNRWML